MPQAPLYSRCSVDSLPEGVLRKLCTSCRESDVCVNQLFSFDILYITGTSHLRHLFECLHDLYDWKALGLYLGISYLMLQMHTVYMYPKNFDEQCLQFHYLCIFLERLIFDLFVNCWSLKSGYQLMLPQSPMTIWKLQILTQWTSKQITLTYLRKCFRVWFYFFEHYIEMREGTNNYIRLRIYLCKEQCRYVYMYIYEVYVCMYV